MRICHYPGRAIDATLSLEQKSPMENIYANNWLNADKTIKTIGRNSSVQRHMDINRYTQNGKSMENVYSAESNDSGVPQTSSSDEEHRRNSHSSSLGRYQVTLEQMQKLNLEQPNELFKKTMRNLNGYKPSTIRQKDRRSYDDWDHENESDTVIRPRTTTKDQRQRHSEHFVVDSPAQRQLAHAQSVSMPKINRSQTLRFPSARDQKNLSSMNIRNMFQQNGDKSSDEMPTATINKTFNRTRRGHLTHQFDGYDMPAANGRPPVNGRTMPPSRHLSVARATDGIEPLSDHKTLCNMKSVRINPTPRTYDNGFAAVAAETERIEQHKSVEQKQRKLPRLISIMKKRSNGARKKSPPPPKAAPILDQWIESQKQHKVRSGAGHPVQRNATSSDSKNSSTSSLSSASSHGNNNTGPTSNVSDFSIPRPRLIVPVHTYARRRRTGNLVQGSRTDAEVNESDLLPFDRYQSVPGGHNNGKQNPIESKPDFCFWFARFNSCSH